MTDLFNLPETLSPRLAWMKRHGVRTQYIPMIKSHWEASCESTATIGTTEDEAITNLAKRLNIPLWNEEGFK